MPKSCANFLLFLCSFFMLVCLLLFPAPMLDAAGSGLLLWFHTVLPSLFPFMVLIRLLMASGAADLAGRLISPIMRPIFRVSGSGAFAYLMGLVSGYPMGAKITSTLYCEGKITQAEAQRLLSFVNNPGALFLLGSVATGMLASPRLGYLLMLSAALASVTTGLLFRFYGPRPMQIKAHAKSRTAPNEKIGVLLSSAVEDAIHTITLIGGFIILFSVLSEAFKQTGILAAITKALSPVLPPSLGPDAVDGLLSGILEMTGGCQKLAKSLLPPPVKVSACAFLLSFGGLSILAQTLSLLPEKGISVPIYLVSKLLNGLFAAAYAYLLFPLSIWQKETAPAFLPMQDAALPTFTPIFLGVLPFLCFYAFRSLFCRLKGTL